MPFVKPATVHCSGLAVAATVQDWPPGAAVTVYVSAAPPVVDGDTVTTAWPFPAVADGAGGVPGAIAADGVTELEALEDEDVPIALVAVDVNVYDVPGVRLPTTQDVAGTVTVHEPPAGDDVTV